jgi:hypothetical protein
MKIVRESPILCHACEGRHLLRFQGDSGTLAGMTVKKIVLTNVFT